ncbi:unknown [Ruminococcus sp. CAG:379]|nr:unknown [Ruminococcus sp. CAG:379]
MHALFRSIHRLGDILPQHLGKFHAAAIQYGGVIDQLLRLGIQGRHHAGVPVVVNGSQQILGKLHRIRQGLLRLLKCCLLGLEGACLGIQLLLGGCQGLLSLFQFLLLVCKLTDLRIQIRSAILQLLPGSSQLIRQLLLAGFIGFPTLIQILSCLIQFLLRIRPQLLLPETVNARCVRLQLFCVCLHCIRIDLVIGIQLPGILQSQEHVRVYLQGERPRRHQDIAFHLAVAYGGGTPLKVHIHGPVRNPHYGKGVGFQGIRHRLLRLCRIQGQSIPHLEFPRSTHLDEAFVRLLRPSALPQSGGIQILGRAGANLGKIHRPDPGNGAGGILRMQILIRGIAPITAGNPLALCQLLNLRPGEAHRGFQMQIRQVGVLVVGIRRQLHIRTGDLDPGEKSAAQGDDGENSKESALGLPDAPQGIFEYAPIHTVTTQSALPAPDAHSSEPRVPCCS